MEFKAVALDMDGTLLNAENRVDEDLAAFLQEVRGQGVKLFLASGRSEIEIRDAVSEDFVFDGMVSANGMGVYRGEEKLAQHAIEPEVTREAVRLAREMGIYYELHPLRAERFALVADRPILEAAALGERPETLLENEWHARKEAVSELIAWRDELVTDEIIKVYFFSKDQDELAKWMDVLADLQERFSFSTSSSSAHNVEIMVAGVDKGTGVQMLLDAYEIDSGDMLAVGDAENDLPMFRVAGMAVAMENAQHHVKAEADDMTDLPYDEGGLLDYLEQWF